MFEFGLENLRRLKSVRPIEIKPITVLVGRNSSGKSTFLRTFPLLRQSLLTRISSPVLWYGDFVDFGSFNEAVFDNDPDKTIVFKFSIDNVYVSRSPYAFEFDLDDGTINIGKVQMEFYVGSSNNKTRLTGFHINTDRTNYKLELGERDSIERFKVNNRIVDSLLHSVEFHIQTGTMFPNLGFRSKESKPSSSFGFYYSNFPFSSLVADIIRKHIDGRAKEEVVQRLAIEILQIGEFSDAEIERLEERSSMRSFKKLLSDVRGPNKKGIREPLLELFQINQFSQIAAASFERLRALLSGTRYIGPVRARRERYYRYQELAVSEIDSDGKNFPMFLNSLSHRQRESFSSWVKERFGYGVSVSQSTGHISINLIRGSSTSNIVDTGFGVSQVLPVLGQIWWASAGQQARPQRMRRDETFILAIEQPELHLHPAHQALLADAIVGERASKRDEQRSTALQFLIETHSEAFVNRLGEIIHDGKIDAHEVQILVFENDLEDDSITTVRVATFDRDGTLSNWPYGFFQPIPL